MSEEAEIKSMVFHCNNLNKDFTVPFNMHEET
jgi:hypothetical protein